jgi:carbon monoxide dehydrogenase subunit G
MAVAAEVQAQVVRDEQDDVVAWGISGSGGRNAENHGGQTDCIPHDAQLQEAVRSSILDIIEVGRKKIRNERGWAVLRFDGDKDFAQPPSQVWDKLTDARFLLECIPGVESVSKAEKQEAAWKLRPGFSFVRGTLDVNLRVVETVPGSEARAEAHSKGIGSTSDVEATFKLTPTEAGTRLHWTAEITSLGGLLKAVPQGLLKASAQKVITDILAAAEQRLAG